MADAGDGAIPEAEAGDAFQEVCMRAVERRGSLRCGAETWLPPPAPTGRVQATRDLAATRAGLET